MKKSYMYPFLIILSLMISVCSQNDWQGWVYASNNIRNYIGKFDNKYSCRYHSRQYIMDHTEFFTKNELKYKYVCGKACNKYEGKCRYRFVSSYLDYDTNIKDEKRYISLIQVNYIPSFLTYAGEVKIKYLHFISNFWYKLSDEEQMYLSKYYNFEFYINLYSDETLSHRLNLYSSPSEFEASLKFWTKHVNNELKKIHNQKKLLDWESDYSNRIKSDKHEAEVYSLLQYIVIKGK